MSPKTKRSDERRRTTADVLSTTSLHRRGVERAADVHTYASMLGRARNGCHFASLALVGAVRRVYRYESPRSLSVSPTRPAHPKPFDRMGRTARGPRCLWHPGPRHVTTLTYKTATRSAWLGELKAVWNTCAHSGRGLTWGVGEAGPKSRGERARRLAGIGLSELVYVADRRCSRDNLTPRSHSLHRMVPAAPILVQVRALRDCFRQIWGDPPLRLRTRFSDTPDRPLDSPSPEPPPRRAETTSTSVLHVCSLRPIPQQGVECQPFAWTSPRAARFLTRKHV